MGTTPPRVALLTDSDIFAGTERHILELARGLRGLDVQVRVICPHASPLAERARREHIPVTAMEKQGAFDPPAVSMLRGLVSAGTLDMIHAHNGRTALAAAVAVRLAGRGCAVATQHFIEPGRTTRRGIHALLSNAAHRWLNSNLACAIAVSTAAREAMVSRGDFPDAKIDMIPNGISQPEPSELAPAASVRRELGVPAGAPLIVCAARLDPEKGIATLIEAMAALRKAWPEARCIVCGEGAERAALQTRIDEAGLASRVILIGFRPDALALIRAADVFVLPSPAEPFGLVLLEAMALGRPVVATRAGGPLEIVEGEKSGLLVAPGSAPELAHALGRLLGDPGERERMGAAGCARFSRHYTAARMSAATLETYQRVFSPCVSS